MKIYHKVIFTLKILFLSLIVLVKTNIIPTDTPFQNIVDETFKIFLGIFVLYISFPWRKNMYNIEKEDFLFIFMTGMIFLLSIDYKGYVNSLKEFIKRVKNRSIRKKLKKSN